MALTKPIEILAFHHVEFICADATTTSRRFMNCLGGEIAAKSDLSSGNTLHSSYLMQSGDVRLLFSAPSNDNGVKLDTLHQPLPMYSTANVNKNLAMHGLSVCTVAISVHNVSEVYEYIMSHGGKSTCPPTTVKDRNPDRGSCDMAEVSLYGDVSLRLVDVRNFKGTFLPNFVDVVAPDTKLGKYGIDRIDHIVGNVHNLQATLKYIKNMTVSVLSP
jgi:4-hydroxyphenylpyruvate dioxygenase